MSTYTDIRYDYNLPSGFGGGLNLLATNTITSGVASSSFTSGIDSSYRTYMFKFINIHPAIDGVEFQFNGSTDGGSNYNVTKTTTKFEAGHNESGSASNLNYVTTQDLAQSTAYQMIHGNIGGDNDQSGVAIMYLFSPSSTTFVKHFLSVNQRCNSNEYTINSYLGGYFNTTSAINAIDFKVGSGNIDNGIIKMYGIA